MRCRPANRAGGVVARTPLAEVRLLRTVVLVIRGQEALEPAMAASSLRKVALGIGGGLLQTVGEAVIEWPSLESGGGLTRMTVDGQQSRSKPSKGVLTELGRWRGPSTNPKLSSPCRPGGQSCESMTVPWADSQGHHGLGQTLRRMLTHSSTRTCGLLWRAKASCIRAASAGLVIARRSWLRCHWSARPNSLAVSSM
jgi:hypothetical protein